MKGILIGIEMPPSDGITTLPSRSGFDGEGG